MKDVPRFERLLLEKRKEVLENRRSVVGEAGEAAPSAYSFHAADHAGAAYDREVGARVLEAEADLLRDIETALARIREGRYGVCETCGGEIPVERLEAKPWARQCVPCRTATQKGSSPNHRPNGRRR